MKLFNNVKINKVEVRVYKKIKTKIDFMKNEKTN